MSWRTTGAVSCAVAVAVLTGCGREPAAPPPTAEPALEITTPVDEPAVAFETFDAPFTNPDLDLAVRALPTELTGTYNTGNEIMLVGSADPSLFVFVGGDAAVPPTPPSAMGDELGRWLSQEPTARSLGSGTTEIPSDGSEAPWYGLRYEEDGEVVEEVRMVTTHPNGRGHLVLRARRPGGLGDPQAVAGLLARTRAEMLSIS